MDWMSRIRSYAEDKVDDYSGMNFPASKGEILDNARRQHLPPEVIDRLEKLPDKQYNNISELVKEAGKGII